MDRSSLIEKACRSHLLLNGVALMKVELPSKSWGAPFVRVAAHTRWTAPASSAHRGIYSGAPYCRWHHSHHLALRKVNVMPSIRLTGAARVRAVLQGFDWLSSESLRAVRLVCGVLRTVFFLIHSAPEGSILTGLWKHLHRAKMAERGTALHIALAAPESRQEFRRL